MLEIFARDNYVVVSRAGDRVTSIEAALAHRMINFDAHRVLANADVHIDFVTISQTRGPVYSETAMEWEKGK